MKVCIYCGKDFTVAAELRKHLRASKYTKQNLAVRMETRGTRLERSERSILMLAVACSAS
ncbi:hypothetical protein BJY01DRAFT_213562 [Aspergillus pseudoustus]|uniref:C2H2-type domain-containing protein n=1 Tax=Aspergillus pseudoustus TaxID=1810923 RepID=A0ABR4K1J8_9EURO